MISQPSSRPDSARYSAYNLHEEEKQIIPLSGDRIGHSKRRSRRGVKAEEDNDYSDDKALRETPSRSIKAENILRKSIDAITLADRSSLGRLSRSNLHIGTDEEPSLPEPSISAVSPQQQEYVPSLMFQGGGTVVLMLP